MRRPARPLLIVLAVSMLAALAPATASATDSVTAAAISAAERSVLSLTNTRRANAGLVSLKPDWRLFALARERATYMAQTDTFSHVQADGTTVFDLMSDEKIAWYAGGEIIAWNTAASLDYSASYAVKAWMDSTSHRAIVLSSGYNYVGFGLAISPTTGRRYWAGVYLKGPDRTGAWAKVASTSKSVIDSTSAKVTVKWTGNDTRLQVLTAGLRYYQVQTRRDGGSWSSGILTTATSISRTWSRGHTYDVRIRARDKVYNWGAWATVTVKP
jgi:uncharacterized protein YkwD